MSIVSVTTCRDYSQSEVSEAFTRVLSPFGAPDWLKPGVKIVIKANLVSMMKPESAATTHPALLVELCKRLREAGAEVIVGDSPGGLYNAAYVNAIYSVTGVKAVTETGADVNHDFGHTHAANPNGLVMKELDYTSYLDWADVIINFCKLKTHGMMGLSASVKNMFGCIPGTVKPEYHYRYNEHRTFANMLIDINERFKPRLCIVDAVDGMEGNGPTAGKPRHIGALLASDSPYACDVVCAQIIGLNPDEIETISAARERGLEPAYDVFGTPEQFYISDYDLVRNRKEMSFNHELQGITGKLFGKIVKSCVCPVPDVKKADCIGCEKCFNICPAKAITMKDRKPVIDRSKCIRCFCCQEFCPKGAMKVKRPLIARLLNK